MDSILELGSGLVNNVLGLNGQSVGPQSYNPMQAMIPGSPSLGSAPCTPSAQSLFCPTCHQPMQPEMANPQNQQSKNSSILDSVAPLVLDLALSLI